MDTEEKKKKIQEIEFMLNEYERVDYNRRKLWAEEDHIKSAIMKRILEISGHKELLDKLLSFVGKKVMITGSDRYLEILNVKDITFDKWEVRLIGEGVRTNDNSIYKSYSATIKLSNLEKELNKMFVVNESVTTERFIAKMEEQKNARIKETVEKIEAIYKADIENFKKYLNAEINEDELEDCRLRSRDEDRLDEIANISLGKLKKLALGVPDPNEKYDVISD